MRIFLDGAFYGWSGIGRVFSWLVSEMALRDDVEKVFCALASSSVPEFEREFAGVRERIEIVHRKGSRFSAGGMFGYAVDLSSLSHQIDVIHFLHTNIPFHLSSFGVPIVVTVHDLRPFTRYAGISPLKSYFYRVFIAHSIRRADAIVTDSETIRQDVLRRFRLRPSQTTAAIAPGMSLRVPAASTSGGLPVEGRYILFVGDIRPHKNLETLLSAFQHVRKGRSDLRLVVVGRPHAAGRQVLSAMESAGVTLLGRVDDGTLGRLYTNAELLVLPSLYEGYGIPPFEAMSRGCPVLCSDLPVLRELYGDSVSYVDPLDAGGMARAVLEIVNTPEKRSRMIGEGTTRVEKLRIVFRNSVDRYMQLYQQLLRC